MNLILITGLDGSGKSTLIKKLEDSDLNGSLAFLRVPVIDTYLYKDNGILYNTCCMINELHSQANESKIPQLKVIAMFSSMIVFSELLKLLNKKNPKFIFCERHPLIDTSVYARFYSGSKMDPLNIPESLFSELNKKYKNEFAYLFSLLDIPLSGNLSLKYLEFIHNHFTLSTSLSVEQLKKMFKTELPDKVYYLEANPEVLMQRLSQRADNDAKSKNLEAHESAKAFEKMLPVYMQVLENINTEIIKIDANSVENLNLAFEQLKFQYLK